MPAYLAFGSAESMYFQTPSDEPEFTPNMWSLLARGYNTLKAVVASSSTAGLIIPLLFMFAGGIVIYQQFRPTITEQLKTMTGYYDQGTASPVALDYLPDNSPYISNPGADYFQKIDSKLHNVSTAIDEATMSYQGKMYLTVPSLGFDHLPVTSNVESSSKESYNQILNYSLAHFRGTSLPFAQNPGNTVIYGHSATASYNPSPRDVLAAFSFLSQIKIGDSVYLEVNNTSYTYRIINSEIIKPDDVSVLDSTPGKHTLTMITCHPPGNNTHRLVTTAVLMES